MSVDQLLTNAKIVDGTGAPWFSGAVAIRDDVVHGVYRDQNPGVDGSDVLDLDGKVLAPGFVDTHSHSDLELFDDPRLAPKTRQGITTEVLGQDGFSMAPIDEAEAAAWQQHLSGLAGRTDASWTWGSLAEYFDAIERNGIALNVGTHVGHGTVRFDVMGMADREPTEAELQRMADLVGDALDDGALGFSTGLIYAPCTYATTEEVQRLASELSPYGRPFVAHIRSEGRWIWDALDEFVTIGADEDVPIHLSHFKLGGAEQFGKVSRATSLIDAARERGVDFTAEQYPYTAGSTMLSAVLPPWVHGGGPEETLAILQDEDEREEIRRDVAEWRIDGWENPGPLSGWDDIVVTNTGSDREDLHGKSIDEIASTRGVDPVTAVMDLLVEEDLEASIVSHWLAEPDVREIMANDRVNIATDGLFGGKPHPRVYGTYPRVLGHYSRDENLFPLEEAVRKMTSLPARAMGLDTKGILRPGMDADLVVFDPNRVASNATYDSPRRYPTGISHVVVNGTFVVRDGDLTGATPGTVIRG